MTFGDVLDQRHQDHEAQQLRSRQHDGARDGLQCQLFGRQGAHDQQQKADAEEDR